MNLSSRLPRCAGCVRDHLRVIIGGDYHAIVPGALHQQQIRGKQKQAKGTGEVTARLLKDVKGFGKAGTIVPVAAGRMRNSFFPLSMAVYVTTVQLKALNIPRSEIIRDFTFGTRQATDTATSVDLPQVEDTEELIDASMFRKKAPDIAKISPERSMELIEIFVPARLDFYRQPIIEEVKEVEQVPPPEEPARSARKPRALYGAGADLMAARERGAEPPKPATPQSIYGSVSTQDVLVAIRAALANNDESARVVLLEEDVNFVDLPELEGVEAGRVKHVGDYAIEVKIRGAEAKTSRRVVRVHAQEL